MSTPTHVTIREVALRDGLQIEPPIPLSAKLDMLAAIAATGVREVEVEDAVAPPGNRQAGQAARRSVLRDGHGARWRWEGGPRVARRERERGSGAGRPQAGKCRYGVARDRDDALRRGEEGRKVRKAGENVTKKKALHPLPLLLSPHLPPATLVKWGPELQG